MARADYRTNTELRRLLHWRYASQDLNSSENDTSFGATIPIKGVLVGADFSEAEHSDVQRAISSSLDMELIRNYTLSYMLTSGDPVIADAWSTCMLKHAGFYVWFGPRNGAATTINVEFRSPNDRYQEFKISEVQWSQIEINGRKRVMAPIKSECLRLGREYKASDKCSFVLDTVESSAGMLLVVNGMQSSWWQLWGGTTGSATAFLPPNMKWVSSSDRVVTTSLDPPVISSESMNYWERGVRQLPRVCVERSKVGGDAVTFIRATAKSWKFQDCNGSEGFCRASPVDVSDERFCWGGSMRTDRNGNSCICKVAAEIEVIKSRWQPVSLSPVAASK
ncbi:hypothetical protein [Pseudomonas solani]|uniref:hypothetical protein n=1 Tax=Pseudomonas solani TaxID=2731552 RepID=UPI003D6C4A5B